MGERIRTRDWSNTPVGPLERWPQSLRMALRIMLSSSQPIWVGWGPELTFFYNDPYKSIIGGKHPWALGQPMRLVWQEIWRDISHLLEAPLRGGQGTYVESQLLIMERNGYPEETYYTFSYSPIPDGGAVGGIFCANSDDTQRAITERQLGLLHVLATHATHTRSWRDLRAQLAEGLRSNPRDLPFAMIYTADRADPNLTLECVSGIERGHAAAPEILSADTRSPWPFAEVLRTRETVVVADIARTVGASVPFGPWGVAPKQAALVPIPLGGDTSRTGILVVGLNPYRLFDSNYRSFLTLVAGQISAAIANAHAYEEERRRAEALAEIDRAKTVFFSNVSHEFRTPLTLILGPLEQATADPHIPAAQRVHLDRAYRNSLRLLKLVNTLLDFSRIEAGRMQASFEPTELDVLTRDLASTFRSAIERAGLGFTVECGPVDAPVYIDREMWEKIVLNLLSNAFKYTLRGSIAVHLASEREHAVLSVADTGSGIPEREKPHVFERFHRVTGTVGRTQEGSGIGLALVQELVRLHGGTVELESELGRGTTFRVLIPYGHSHLPSEHIRAERSANSTALGAQAFVQEALRWLPENEGNTVRLPRLSDLPTSATAQHYARVAGARIVLADDNADMRAYVGDLLAPFYRVEPVENGTQALAAARRELPNLIMSDIMMAGMDGLELLKSLRTDETLQDVPVILLSARAGEEARIEGLDAGADDYLTKPFSARELLARVGALLELTQLRRENKKRLELALVERDQALSALRESAQEREQLLSAERAARADAETANRLKDEFLATLSHELRTPLSNVVSWSRLLQKKYSGDDDYVRRGLNIIADNALSQAQVIADLLDMSRIVSGKLQLELEPCDLAQLVESLVASHRPAAEAKRILLEATLVSEPLLARVDTARMRQVLWNLLSNAIKFTPEAGHVVVELHRAGEYGQVVVRDTGIGIPAAFLPHVFERFRQADSSTGRRYGGLGLGLAIVKQLVELHGGTVRAHSDGEGQGSTFTVEVPLPSDLDGGAIAQSLSQAAPEILEEQVLKGMRILAVEDDAAMLELLGRVLGEYGAELTSLSSAAAALDLLRNGESFHLLLSDLGLSPMDGFTFLRAVRAQYGPEVLPAIALTAFSREEDRARAIAAGFQGYLTKPYEVAKLVGLARRLGRMDAGT